MSDQGEKIFALLLFPLTYLATWIIPKKRNLWLFGAWFGRKYEDSPRVLFERCHERGALGVEAYWIYKGERPVSGVVAPEYFVNCHSARGTWLQLRARVYFMCVNSLDFNPGCISRRSILIQTWHGTPMKAIGYPVLRKALMDRVKFWVRWFLTDNYSMVLSPNEFTDRAFADAFQLPRERMFRSEYPRCSSLFAGPDKRKRIREKVFGVQDDVFLWVYLPTHRNEGKDGVQTGIGLSSIESLVRGHLSSNCSIYFKPHFYEERFFADRDSLWVKKWPADSEYSFYELLAAADGLITDYSSVAYDFAVTGRPIIIFDFDLHDYRTTNRSLIRLPSEDFEDCAQDEDGLEELVESLSRHADRQGSCEFEGVTDRILDAVGKMA
jgi:CDP-glycerol glycerophosphotransferase